MSALRASPPKQRPLHSVRSEMFIAVNADQPPSPFGGADEQVAIYPSGQSRSSERRRGLLLFQNYKHLAPNGAKTSACLPPMRRATGLPCLGHVRVVGLLFD